MEGKQNELLPNRASLHRPVQAGENFGGEKQSLFALHGFILPCPSDKTGTLPASIPDPSSLEPEAS